MSFEMIDNVLQVTLFFLFAILSLVLGAKRNDRRFWLLSGCYACYAMGTLYYVLYLGLNDTVPQVFCVSEVAWLASYLFLLYLRLMTDGEEKRSISLPVAAVSIGIMGVIFYYDILGPSLIIITGFALSACHIFYISCLDFIETRKKISLSMAVVICLQVLLYVVSSRITDYTHFNSYFAVDLLLTTSICSVFFQLKREDIS